jgi:hypothetical protein
MSVRPRLQGDRRDEGRGEREGEERLERHERGRQGEPPLVSCGGGSAEGRARSVLLAFGAEITPAAS